MESFKRNAIIFFSKATALDHLCILHALEFTLSLISIEKTKKLYQEIASMHFKPRAEVCMSPDNPTDCLAAHFKIHLSNNTIELVVDIDVENTQFKNISLRSLKESALCLL